MEDYKARCAGCFSDNLKMHHAGWRWCLDCGRQFTTDYLVWARRLSSSPAPPLTQDEVDALQEPVWLY